MSITAERLWNSGASVEEAISLGFGSEFKAYKIIFGCKSIPVPLLGGQPRVRSIETIEKELSQDVGNGCTYAGWKGTNLDQELEKESGIQQTYVALQNEIKNQRAIA
jgi:hypothetical protein